MSRTLDVALAAAAIITLGTPASAARERPQPVLSQNNLDRLENDLGWIGLLGLLGLLGLRRRDERR